jgi:hypothetical protein
MNYFLAFFLILVIGFSSYFRSETQEVFEEEESRIVKRKLKRLEKRKLVQGTFEQNDQSVPEPESPPVEDALESQELTIDTSEEMSEEAEHENQAFFTKLERIEFRSYDAYAEDLTGEYPIEEMANE